MDKNAENMKLLKNVKIQNGQKSQKQEIGKKKRRKC